MTMIFYLFGLGLLLFMAYVLWSGVGRRRPALGRGFAAIALAIAAFVIYLLGDQIA